MADIEHEQYVQPSLQNEIIISQYRSVASINNIFEEWSRIKNKILEEKNAGEIIYSLYNYFLRTRNDESSRATSLARELFEELYRVTKHFNTQQDGGTSLFNFLGSRTGVYLISLLEHLSHEPNIKIKRDWLVEYTKAINNLLALPSVYASSAESNPSRSQLNKAKEELQQLPQQFATYAIQSLDKLYAEQLSPLPQNFAFVADTLTIRSSAPSTSNANIFADDNSIQLVGCLSYHLLAVLFNLCASSARTADELISSEEVVDNLLAILSVKPQLVDFGLFFVQQQLTRTLARAILSLCQDINKYSSSLYKSGVITKLVSNLRSAAQLPSVICIELAQVIVYTIKIVSPSSDKLLNEFIKSDGYSTFADNLLVVGNSTTKELQERYIAILCHLLFVGKKSSESLVDILTRNISALNIFLCVFTETKSDRLKIVLVRVICETITLIAERYDLCKDLEPFQVMFMQFDQLASADQKQVLATMIAVLSKSTLFPPELRAFVQLLSSKKVGTPAMILDNLTTLLAQKKLRRSEQNKAGLLDALIEFIGASSIDAELLRKALKVLRLMLNGHSQNQLYLAMRGGVTKLLNYISDNNFRRDVLHVIAIIALGEVTSQSKIVFDLIQILQSSGGTAAIDTETINKRKDILSVLSYIFSNNAAIRESFRIGGGFVWIISVLGGLGRSIDEVTNRDEIYSFVLLLIEVLVNTMRGNMMNQAYMRDEIGYQTILDALTALRIAEQGQYQVPLISALLSLSVSGGWPGNCGGHTGSFKDESDTLSIVHLHHWARDFTTLKHFVKTSLVTTKDRSNLCSKCKDELMIDAPELLEMTFNLLIKKDSEKNDTEGDGAAISRDVLQLDDNYNDIDAIEESNLGLYLIVQALRLLTTLHLSNRVVLAKHSFVGLFLNNFKATLISHPNTREKARFQFMLLELLRDAAQFHITPEELKKCFGLLREDPPALFLETLNQVFKRGNAPSHISHFPRRKNVLIKSPLIEEKNWPPLQGFSVGFWFQVINQGETFGERKPITLMTLDSKTKAGKFEVVFYKGLITVRSAATQSITFTDFMFKEDRWYHLALIHTSKEQIKLYVDGILYKQTTLAYPSSHHVSFSCVFGTPGSDPNNTPTVSWSLGNFYLFDMPLDDSEVFLCYCLGPNYVGTLQQTQMGWFQVFDIINARNLSMHKNRLHLVTHLNKSSLNSIKEKIVLLYSAKNMVFAGPDIKIRATKVMTPQKLPLSPVVRASQAIELNSFVEYSPVIIGDVLRIIQMSAKECLQSVGGVSMIIYLFGVCKTKEHQLEALRLLKTSLEWSATNVREMSSMGGYEIISKLIRKRYAVPDEDLLEVLFSFCGLRRSSRDETFSAGVIQDLNALHNFILDWNLWKKSSVQVQALLFLSLSRCVLTHELAAIHAHRLRNADVVPTVLRILEEDQLSGVPARYAVELLGPLAPPSQFDEASNDQSLVPLNQLFAFLLASHSAETSQAPLNCPLDAIHRSPMPLTRVTGTTPPTLKSLRSAEGAEETPAEQIREKRDLILNLLLETLKKCPSEVVVPFFEQTMTIEVMFALMQTRDESTLVLLLRVLEVLLRDPKNVARFKRTYGFDLLGYHLRSYAVSTDVFGVLFSIAIGKSDTFTGFNVSSVQNFLHFNNQKQGQEPLKLEHPEALTSILIASTSCHIAGDVQHSVVKVIHDLFLQNDAIKGQMINGGIIELLCHLLVSTFEHKQALFAKGLSNEDLEHHWEIEIDVLGLLNAIALYGFMSSFGQVLTEEILVALHVLPFPFDYSVALQRRVLYDVLDFFNKSQSADQKLVIQAEKLLELSVTSMLFLSTKTAQQEKLRRSKAYRYKTRNPSASPLGSSDMSLTQSVDRSLSLSDPTKYMKRENSLKILPTSPSSKPRDFASNPTNNDTVRKRVSESSEFSLNKTLPADFSESEDEDSMSELVQASKYLNIPVTIASNKTPTSSPRFERKQLTPRKEENNTNVPESPSEIKKPQPMDAGFATPPNEPSDSGYMSAPMTPRTAAKAQSDLEEFIESAKILTKESEFVRIMFTMFMNNLKKKKSGSLLRKLYSKAVSSSDRDLSWFFERFIIHTLTTYKSPQTLKVALEFIPQVNMEIFNSDRDTYSRILLYSSPLLSRDGVQLECWEMWKTLAKTKIVSELMMFPEDTPMDLLGPGDEGELILMTEVVNTVGKLEKRDAGMVKEVTQVLIDFVNKARSVVRSRSDFLRQISSTFSNKFITAQHALTKPLMDFIKELMERSKKTRQQWKKLLKRVRPDRSPWAVHPSLVRWELDPTEGPMRMRLRLRKVWANHHPILGATYTQRDGISSGPSSANLSSGDLDDAPKIDPTNLYLEYNIPQQLIDDMNWIESLCDDNEDFEMDTNFLEHELQPGDQIISTYKCASITPFHKRDGEILIGSFNAYFIDSHRFQTTAERHRKITSVRKHLIFPYDEIEAIHKRRYLLKNSALEIFLINGRTYLMAFEKEAERDSVYESLTKMEMVNFVDYENSAEALKADLTKRWQRGRITNFEYLMHLNTLAGRSFNDLTQYPVFPFILGKYKKSRELNVNDPNNYRNLSKPMGAQTEERLQKFIEKYKALVEMGEPPFLYGSHYSNIGSVLHFLVRLEPFSRYFVEFQGGKFDVPDRVFHSLDTTWELSSAMSTSDVKELVPEFFYLPEFLVNNNGFKLGTKQDGQVVNNVLLPYWAKGDAREFIERHREAMESRFVSENLHNWIDLMFGYKQTGEAALKALNVFHPLTYEGAVDIDKISDPVMRAATITQISNYGQVPKQIFKKPHPPRGLVPVPNETVYANYDRLSPHPLYSLSGQVGFVEYVRGSPVALGINKCILWPYGELCLQWGNWDGSLRITSLKEKGRVVDQIESFEMFNDSITAVDVSRNGWLIAAGFESSVVRLWRNRPYSMKYRQLRGEDVSQLKLKANRIKADNIALIAELNGHDGAVTCLKVSSDWSLVLSGSRDGTVIVWDSNHARYIRQLRPLHSDEPVVVPSKEAPMSIDELSLINTLSAHDSSAENSSAEVSSESPRVTKNIRRRPTGPPEPDLVNLGITAVNIHPYTGEIITVLETTKGSLIDVWSINGERLASQLSPDQVLCVTFTTCKPGLGVNLLITGHMSGELKLWSMRDLTLLKSLTRNATPVTAIGVSPDDCQIVSGDSSGMLVAYLAKPLDRPHLGLEVGL